MRIRAGLFVIIGESFRSGGQGSRTRGEASSYDDQMKATKSQIKALAFLESKFGVKIDVSIGTYHTQYTNDLVSAFGDRIVGKPDIRHEDNAAGLTSFFKTALERAAGPEKTLDQIYDFIFFCRVDIYLKGGFQMAVDLNWPTIRFPFICWVQNDVTGRSPRVSDFMLFVPSKYFSFLPHYVISHDSWRDFVTKSSLTKWDLDVMITTFHDSDSFKDWNPLYRIANRPENNEWNSICLNENSCVFDKFCRPNTKYRCTRSLGNVFFTDYLGMEVTGSLSMSIGAVLLLILSCLGIIVYFCRQRSSRLHPGQFQSSYTYAAKLGIADA